MGTLAPANGSHKHRDGRKEALFQGLVLCRSGPRAQISLRAQLMGESKRGGQGHHLQEQLGQGERDVAEKSGSSWMGFFF